MNEQIGRANENVADGLNRTLAEAGFKRNGDHYERQTVVDSTITGPLTELHTVPSYQAYQPSEPIAPKVDLSDARLQQFSSLGVQGQVDLAIREMRGEMEKIFGKEGRRGA